jgi:internalin A
MAQQVCGCDLIGTGIIIRIAHAMFTKSALTKLIQEARRDSRSELDLSGHALEKLPELIGELRALKELNLADNRLRSLPASFGELRQLQALHLDGNQFTEFPESIGEMRKLRTLYLGDNPVTALPEWVGKCRQLRILGVDKLGLTQLPDWICELRELLVLRASKNRLTALPDCISRLRRLGSLSLDDNSLASLPLSLKMLPSLRRLFLYGNPSLEIPTEILDDPADPANILDYYFRIRSGSARPLNEAKLILVGRGEVGKTSLIERLTNDQFRPQKKTEGIQVTQWPVQLETSENVRLHIWDFGGQEIMHATHQFFLTERSLYLLVLNGREGGEDTDVEYWLKLIESFGGDSPVIIALNKIRSHSFDLNRRGLLEKYPGRIREFVRTDCEDGTGIEELKRVLLRETGSLPHLRDKFPSSWCSIKERLSAPDENYISFDDFRKLCDELGERDPKSQEMLAKALHCLGIALNYKDDPRLKETHVLKPSWVTNSIYRILNSELLERNRGELSLDDLVKILDRSLYPPPIHDFLLTLMRKFELCFRFPEPRDNTFLIPQLLGKEQPDLGGEFELSACLNFQYTYPVWPEGLLPRFIVRTHGLSADELRWRTGVVLGFEGNRALVKADPQDKKVIISVSGPLEGRRRLLAVIRSDFERIHGDISKLNPIAAVPLPQAPSIAIPYEELRVYESNGVTSIPQVIGSKVVPVEIGKLLNSVELPVERAGEAIRVFVSYSHKDDEFRAALDTHLKLLQRTGLIETWHDRRIAPGNDWRREIDRELDGADLILLLVSPDFIASDYCYEVEMKRAMERDAQEEARVIPILIRKCQWGEAPFSKLQALPKNAKPVRLWRDHDSAWSNVAEGIEKVIREIQMQRRGA